jgi:hypothetical protein
MITTGAKFFYGLAAAALVAAVLYWYTSHLEFLGTIILFSLVVVAGFLGSVIVAFRDADLAAPVAEATSAADSEGTFTSSPRVSPSLWPIVAAFGVAITTIGVAYDRRWFVAGLVIVAAAIVEWAVQAWADRASDDPAYNAQVRARIMHPLEFPLLGAACIILVIFGFSRVMLAIPKAAAVIVFILLGATVLLVATLIGTRKRLNPSIVALALVVGAVGILIAGVVGAANGEREFEKHTTQVADPNKKTANKVGDKASVFATVVASSSALTPNQLTVARSLAVNILFENDDTGGGPRDFEVNAGTQPKTDTTGKPITDAKGNAVTEPVIYFTDYIGHGKTALLTVTMPTPGVFTIRSQGGSGVLTGTVVVP